MNIVRYIKNQFLLKTCCVCLLATAFSLSALAQGTAFTYQGRLENGANPATGIYDLRFTIYDSGGGATVVTGPLTNSATGVSNGLFTVTLDFGAGVFTGPARWLEIGVRTNGGGAFTTLAPRQPLTPAPYAMLAALASAVASGSIGNAALQTGAVDSNKIADGTIALADLSPTVVSNTFWRLNGNAGTTPGTQFVGTSDNQALELRANNARAWRAEPNAASPNLIGGSSANLASNGVAGAVVAGGGSAGFPNRVGGSYSTVSGGYNNLAYYGSATVAGGDNNVAAQDRATVGGGYNNRASGLLSTVAGGDSNTASNSYSAVPGGSLNVAGGSYSFAAGYRAKATNLGSFVWADAQGSDFGSTGANQFLIRAQNGVGINLANPSAALDVNGRVKMTQFQLGTAASAGQLLTADAAGAGTWQTPGFVLRSGDTMTGNLNIGAPAGLNFGASMRQMINLWNAEYGLGVQVNTEYFRAGTGGGFAWFRGGAHNDAAGNPGTGGTNLMSLDPDGQLFVNSSITLDNPSSNTGGLRPGLVFGNGSGEGIASKRTAGGNQNGLDFYTAFQPRLSIANNGSVGIGTQTPTGALLDVKGPIRINTNDLYLAADSDMNHGLGYRHILPGGMGTGGIVDGPFLYGYNGGALGVTGPEGAVFSWHWNGDAWLSNNLSVASLNVRSASAGIGRTPTSNALEVEGNASKTVAGSWLANSDARIKRDIQPVTNALAKLGQVRLVSFRYTDEYRRTHPGVEERPYLNVVAQEFREVFPEDVKSSGEHLSDGGEILQVDTYPLTIYAAAAIQELNKKLEGKLAEQAAELKSRENELHSLRSEVEALRMLLETTLSKTTH